MKATNDSIILRGKKHNNRIIMTPIPADKTWESYIHEAEETEQFMASSKYYLTGEGRTDDIEIEVKSNGGYRCLVFRYTDSQDLKQTVTAPYIVDKNGFTFYAPVEVNGMVLDGLDKGDTEDYFLFRNNPKLQLDTYVPPLATQLTTSLWYLNYGSVGEYAKPKWDAMMDILKTAGKNKQKITIYTATIGKLSDTKLGSSLSTSDAVPYWYMNVETGDSEDIAVFSQKSTGTNKTDKAYYNNYKWKDVLNTIFAVMNYAQYAPTAIVLNPITVNAIMAEKDTMGRSLGLVVNQNGVKTISGIPVIELTSIPVGKYLVGDFRGAANLIDYTTLSIEFAEDVDTKLKNYVAVIAQEEIIFPVYMPWAFAYGSLDSVKTAITAD